MTSKLPDLKKGSLGELVVDGPIQIHLNKDQVAAGVPFLDFTWDWVPSPGSDKSPRRYGIRWLAGAGSVSHLLFARGEWPAGEFAVLRKFVGESNEGPFVTEEASFQASAIQTLTDGPTVTPELSKGNIWVLSAAGSRTIAAPTGPAEIAFPRFILLRLLNNTAGAITTTFNAAYHLSWTDPGAGQNRTQVMYYDGSALWQIGAGVTIT